MYPCVYCARMCMCVCVCVCARASTRRRACACPRFPLGGRTRARDVTLAQPRRVLPFYRRSVPESELTSRGTHRVSLLNDHLAICPSRMPYREIGAVARVQRIRVFCTNLCIRAHERASATRVSVTSKRDRPCRILYRNRKYLGNDRNAWDGLATISLL